MPSHQAPFVPRRSIKPLTDVDPNFVLHSDVRAAEREKVSILNHKDCFVPFSQPLLFLLLLLFAEQFDRFVKEKEDLAQELEAQRKIEEEVPFWFRLLPACFCGGFSTFGFRVSFCS